MNTKYPTGLAGLFAAAAREARTMETKVEFRCAGIFRLGAYALIQGDLLTAVSDGRGLYYLYCEWADGALGRFNAHDINTLAGRQVVVE